MLSIDGYSKLVSLVKNASPKAAVFGGHYSRLGMPWDQPTSAKALSAGIQADKQAALAGAMVFDMPLMVSRCRSEYDQCDRGIFHQRQLGQAAAAAKGGGAPKYNGLLFWPNEAIALSGWFQRFTTTSTLPPGPPRSHSRSQRLILETCCHTSRPAVGNGASSQPRVACRATCSANRQAGASRSRSRRCAARRTAAASARTCSASVSWPVSARTVVILDSVWILFWILTQQKRREGRAHIEYS